jgi:hypothetical protein
MALLGGDPNALGSAGTTDCIDLWLSTRACAPVAKEATAACALPQPHGRLQVHVGMLRRRRHCALCCSPAASDAVLPAASAKAHVNARRKLVTMCIGSGEQLASSDVQDIMLCDAMSAGICHILMTLCLLHGGFADHCDVIVRLGVQHCRAVCAVCSTPEQQLQRLLCLMSLVLRPHLSGGAPKSRLAVDDAWPLPRRGLHRRRQN